MMLLVLVLASTVRAQEPTARDPAETSAETSADPETPSDGDLAPPDSPVLEQRALDDGGRLGLALLGGGAALAAVTATTTSLIEALSTNDLSVTAPPRNPELVQVSGFVTISLLSASVGVMLLGGAILVNDLVDAD